jgi:glutamyl-tRNA reductase
MVIFCLGLSHQTAPVELRERLSYPTGALKAALARFGCDHHARRARLKELVILSTCNRLELYAVAPTEDYAAALDFIRETRQVNIADFEPYLYRYAQNEAVEHLARVAAGLDSMTLGEPQILGQITDAFEQALGHDAAGPILSELFRAMIHTGKRARAETAIGHNPATISSVAVKLVETAIGDLPEAHVLILGAGEMAELAVKAFRARGTMSLTVVNRTLERARRLAEQWGAQALTFEQLGQAMIGADIVITSTGAPHTLVTVDLVRAVMQQRPDRPLVLIDIAVPRDVDPDVRSIPHVHCYDIDDLQSHLTDTVAERVREVPHVEAIVAEEVNVFVKWMQSLEIKPVITDLRARADAIRRVELEKTLRHLPNLDESERRSVECLSESLVNKLLHDLTLRLKAEAGNGHAADYAAAVRYLFALEH